MTGGVGNGLEIARSLVLSTAHIHPATARDWMPRCPWSCFEKGDYGWFMHVCDVGTVACGDSKTDWWQYAQSIPSRPAWISCENGTGCSGA